VAPLSLDDLHHLRRIDAALQDKFAIGVTTIRYCTAKANKDKDATAKDIAGRARMLAISQKLKVPLHEAADIFIKVAEETEHVGS
jgi:hypothetical protein